ncbi:hypothetical protein B0H63DRAFT_179947 [Podospora didyma]|uniref:FAD-binding domain-containing protein n=1 Tax=Podospora didyma TaxID=330526 RepID=A0AAE0NP69_9PEZI|nr:hypothetical protein B0H63DRAFT_179947 [Podospora didyma]
MSTQPSHFLEGKQVIVAGAGIAGSAFVAAFCKLWNPALTFPEITVFDRDTREVAAKREGYSLSLHGDSKDAGLVALRQLGVLDEITSSSVFPLNSGRFKVWDSAWDELISIQPKPWGDLPTGAMRIRRKDLRRILIERAEKEKARATFHWGSACTAAERLDNGRIRVVVTSEDGGTTTHECDLLIAADGAHSKIRTSFRPDDKIKYAGAIQMGGNGKFPEGLPGPVGQNWGIMLSGQGVCCFFSAVDKENVVWALSQLEPEREGAQSRDWSDEQVSALKKEALELGHMFGEPFRMIVEATDPSTAFILPARDKQPFRHDEDNSVEGVVFIGDANHAVSPFAGNGANLALKDGCDLAETLCRATSLQSAVLDYDQVSYPRAVATLKSSHSRIGMGHCTGIKHALFRAGLAAGRVALWVMGK